MEITAEHEVSVVLSSHLVADLERVCDYLVLLAASRVQLAGDVEELLATHRRLTGPRRDLDSLPPASRSSKPATPTARARCWCAPTNRSTTQRGPSRRSASRTSCSPICARQPARAAIQARCGESAMIWLAWRQFRLQAAVARLRARLPPFSWPSRVAPARPLRRERDRDCHAHGSRVPLDCDRLRDPLRGLPLAREAAENLLGPHCSPSRLCWGCSGERRCSPGSSRAAPTGWHGLRASPAHAGWP